MFKSMILKEIGSGTKQINGLLPDKSGSLNLNTNPNNYFSHKLLYMSDNKPLEEDLEVDRDSFPKKKLMQITIN